MNNIVVKKLKCGVNCVFEINDFVKSCALGIFVKVGSIDEEKNNYGISHVIEHMLFKGTLTRSAKEIAESTEKIGAQVNAYTSFENTCFHVKSISEYIYEASDILFDMLNNATFNSDELNKERNVILEEMKMTEDTPDELCHETVGNLTFKGTPYEHSIIGTEKIVKNIKSEELINYKNKEYTKDSIVVSVCGNFDIDTMSDYLENKFDKILDKKEEKEFVLKDYVPQEKKIIKDIAQTHICIANRGAKADTYEKYIVSILSEMLGGGMSSRLFQNIREQKGLCYSVFSLNQSYKLAGLFEIYCGLSSENIDLYLESIKNEFDDIIKNDFKIDEFNKAKIQIKSGIIYSSENILSTMFLNGKSLINSNRIISRDEMIDTVSKVTLNEVNQYAKNLLKFDDFTKVIVTNK